MNFNNDFVLQKSTPSSFSFSCEKKTLQLDFLLPTMLRVTLFENDPGETLNIGIGGDFSKKSRTDTAPFELFEPKTTQFDGGFSFELFDGLSAELLTHNGLLSVKKDGEVLFCDRAPLSMNISGEFGEGSFHFVKAQSDEKIFGCGDKCGGLDRHGKHFSLATSDPMGFCAKSSDPLYKFVPFYICKNSVGSFGVFYDTTCPGELDFSCQINNYYGPYKFFHTDDDTLCYYLFLGSIKEIVQMFGCLIGKQAFPPRWSFGLCQSTMAVADSENSSRLLDEFVFDLKKYDISCSGFYLSSGYTSIGKQRFVFHLNKEKFPDFGESVKKLEQNGIKLIPNIKPAFLLDHPLYDELKSRGLFVKLKNGEPFVTQFWDGLGSYLDFSNPEAFDFWKMKVKECLLDFGITATWNDNNEFDIKNSDAVLFDGNLAKNCPSKLTYEMVLSSYLAQTRQQPLLRPFLSTRSGGANVRRFAQTWSGDNFTSFEDLKYCHYIGLSLSMSGFSFYGHDLGGFSGDMPNRELFLRWLQHGVFEPRMTIHSYNTDASSTMPWSYPDIVPFVREIFSERKELLPYIYSSAYFSVSDEIPLNSPCFLHFDDERLFDFPDQMMLFKNILVAFAFCEGQKEITAYIPNGSDFYIGQNLVHGGHTVTILAPAEGKLPYFVKAGTVLPFDCGEYGFFETKKLVFLIYPLNEGEFCDEFFCDDGESFAYLHGDCTRLHFDVICESDTVTVKYKNLTKNKIKPEFYLYGKPRDLVIKEEGE